MNRNAESHFATLPQANIERSRFDRSHSRKFTANVGELVPFCVEPVLPGDTWEIDTSKVLRLQTLVSPVMANAFLDVYWFFVPLRLVWSHTKEFFGENTSGYWYPSVTYTIPKMSIPGTGVDPCSLMDYLGLPPYKTSLTLGTQDVNDLRLRGYLEICNEWFRDQNLENPLVLRKNDSTVVYNANSVELGGKCFVAAKMHDIFTSCLPGPQKAANPVTIPTSGDIPVTTMDPTLIIGKPNYAMVMQNTGTGSIYTNYMFGQHKNDGTDDIATVNTSGNASAGNNKYAPLNLIAHSDNTGVAGSYTLSMSVTDLRLAFQTQKFLERQARGGSRYREVLLSHFGVVSPDARQQVPEYLGGNRIPIQVSQVINQAESANQPLGTLGAYSHTVDVHSDVFKSFTEHGYLYGLAVVRYEHDYSQYADQDWFISDIYDLYWPEFAAISEQPIPTKSIYFQDGAQSPTQNVFGYQEAWARYRYAVNELAGEMRPYVTNGLTSWSFADVYNQAPTLSSSWIKEDKGNVDRALVVQSSVSNQYWADFYIKSTVTRPMPLYSIPGLVDHF